ncbi:transmembrane emp24 domain-containing protein 5-like isoform X2 [Styela clava]|uniref:transmembrane emp24 domain-containing protein 5-like isoform X2 n=1 Tax=Styela clava TaxID=7725 RepID=UPI001939484F|nr:transmembrane emp24 domain-containing protein 5-like isoform X2 [Styela clava]XP_039269746.1 transmembrane emp24 domain-containing protein 5-like isoform X2 [Styela clava]
MFIKLVFYLSVIVAGSFGYRDVDFTVQISPMKRECFYETTKAGRAMDIEFQVIDGGDLDINFMIQAPDGRVVVSDMRKTDGIHTVDPTVEGDYVVCFDNSFSRMTGKTVFFEIIEDSAGEEEEEDGGWKDAVEPDEQYGDKLQSLEDTMNVIRSNLGKTSQLQGLLRAFEAKDRGIAERNFERVNFWSALNIIVMLVVLSLQVYTVRSMFSDNRKVRT